MDSKETKAIIRELAMEHSISADEIRRMCRSQFEYAGYRITTSQLDELKAIHIPDFIEFVVKHKYKKNENT